jgi:hypothetical protein
MLGMGTFSAVWAHFLHSQHIISIKALQGRFFDIFQAILS